MIQTTDNGDQKFPVFAKCRRVSLLLNLREHIKIYTSFTRGSVSSREAPQDQMMHIYHSIGEVSKQIASAQFLALRPDLLPINPFSTAFPDDDAAKILGVCVGDLDVLYQFGILERTAVKTHESVHSICYWDMICATATMSLMAVGYSTHDALSRSFDVFDCLSDLCDQCQPHSSPTYNTLCQIIAVSLTANYTHIDEQHMGHTNEVIAKKLAVDLLLMHQRCEVTIAENRSFYGVFDIADSAADQTREGCRRPN